MENVTDFDLSFLGLRLLFTLTLLVALLLPHVKVLFEFLGQSELPDSLTISERVLVLALFDEFD